MPVKGRVDSGSKQVDVYVIEGDGLESVINARHLRLLACFLWCCGKPRA